MTITISSPTTSRLNSGTSRPVLMWSSVCGMPRSSQFSSRASSPAAKPAISAPQNPLEIQLSWLPVVIPTCAR